MIKFTDPTYPENYFIVINDNIYTVEKCKLEEFLENLNSTDRYKLDIDRYEFKVSNLESEEQYLRYVFEKINSPFVRLLLHE